MYTYILKSMHTYQKRGFTMIELIIVILMIGLLSIAGMAAYTSSLKTGRDSRRKADLEHIRTALELYMSDNSVYPNSLSVLETPKKYINVPLDPSNAQSYYYSPVCSGTPPCTVYDTYRLGVTLEGGGTNCSAIPPVSIPADSCKDTNGDPSNCNYCLDPYGKL